MKLYHELAEYYFSIEKENRKIDDDIKLVASLIKKINNPVLLDLGCGTGEHLAGLSKLGIDCTGIDSSDSMIRIAKLRFPNSIQFIKQDIKTFSFNNKFDIIISLFGSFDYLIENSDIDIALNNIREALKPSGIGLFEVWNAIPIIKIREKAIDNVSKTNYKGKIIERQRGFRMLNHKDKTIVEVNYTYNLSENKILQDKHIMRAFTRKEITNYLGKSGFAVLSCHSNSQMQPYDDSSNRIIISFKKK